MADEGLITPRRGRCAASIRHRSTSCSIRRSIPKRGATSSRTGCRLRRAPPSGAIVFDPDEAEKAARRRAGRSSWCASRRARRTSTACMRREGILTDPRRHDLACRGRGARHGQALRFGRRRHPCRLWPRARCTAQGQVLKTGDIITIDGSTGQVMPGAGRRPSSRSCPGDFATLMEWADAVRRMKVRANAETPADARAGARVRRRGHRPVPHRAHVLRCRTDRRGARDDSRFDAERAGGRRWPRSCRCSGRTSSRCSRSWPGCR